VRVTHDEIVWVLTQYLQETNPVAKDYGPIPLDTPLYEIGILDSYGVIEMVAFIEDRFAIRIHDSELTKERFGGLAKMATLIGEKLSSA
jgi:acyl carrier protein